MSATLRVEDFTENKRLFQATPPVIKVHVYLVLSLEHTLMLWESVILFADSVLIG